MMISSITKILVQMKNFLTKNRLPLWYVFVVFFVDWLIGYAISNTAHSILLSFLVLLSAIIVWLIHRPRKIIEYIWAGLSVGIWYFILILIKDYLEDTINYTSYVTSLNTYYYSYVVGAQLIFVIIPIILPVSIGFAILAKYLPKFSSSVNCIVYISIIVIALVIGNISFYTVKNNIDSKKNDEEFNKRSLFYKILLSDTSNDFLYECSSPIKTGDYT